MLAVERLGTHVQKIKNMAHNRRPTGYLLYCSLATDRKAFLDLIVNCPQACQSVEPSPKSNLVSGSPFGLSAAQPLSVELMDSQASSQDLQQFARPFRKSYRIKNQG